MPDWLLPFIAPFVKWWGSFSINRGEIDRKALMHSIELLKSGQLILIAPEGTRHPEGLSQPKDGFAFIATKADAVIIPTAISGAVDWQDAFKLKRPRINVNFYGDYATRYLYDEGSIDMPSTEGTLVVFPSYLRHSALPYKGERDRVVATMGRLDERLRSFTRCMTAIEPAPPAMRCVTRPTTRATGWTTKGTRSTAPRRTSTVEMLRRPKPSPMPPDTRYGICFAGNASRDTPR